MRRDSAVTSNRQILHSINWNGWLAETHFHKVLCMVRAMISALCIRLHPEILWGRFRLVFKPEEIVMYPTGRCRVHGPTRKYGRIPLRNGFGWCVIWKDRRL